MFAFRDTRDRVEVAFTDRYADDGSTLNLARPGSPPAAVPGATSEEDLAMVMSAFAPDADPVGMTQVHGAEVAVVDRGYDGRELVVDGLVTSRVDVALLVRVADCLPVVLADVDAGVVGVAHAGRRGAAAGVVPATLARMSDLGARRWHAWLGPGVCGGCYEVPAALQQEVCRTAPAARATTRWGTPALDLRALVRDQLEVAGAAVTDVERCTVEDDALWSHRREGEAAGRAAGLVRVRP